MARVHGDGFLTFAVKRMNGGNREADIAMFVRIVWTQPCIRLRPGAYRPGMLPARRKNDDLGIPAQDFDKMTRGLFERKD